VRRAGLRAHTRLIFFFVCEKSIDPGCIVAGIKRSGTFVPATWVGKPGYKLVPNRDYCTFLQ